ncbi:hypothetical protein [Kitasatospora sp. LaBMicrA B282]|uniref:hypothetical protein n=1 Tax=Kitasatospora sp. LaBMicrA B282 TaxID=3420949 RepID=UPI003D11377B
MNDPAQPPSPGVPAPAEPTIEQLLDAAFDTTVATGEGEAFRALAAELEHRGGEAVWAAAVSCLGMLSSLPLHGVEEWERAELLRRVAKTADPVTATTLTLMAAHRGGGERAAAPVWEQARSEVRAYVLLQLSRVREGLNCHWARRCWKGGTRHRCHGRGEPTRPGRRRN